MDIQKLVLRVVAVIFMLAGPMCVYEGLQSMKAEQQLADQGQIVEGEVIVFLRRHQYRT